MDEAIELSSQSKLKSAIPISLGLIFWAVIAAMWLFFFPKPVGSGFLGELLLLIVAVVAPAYLGTVVGCVMSFYSLHWTNGQSWSGRIGLAICGSATVFVAALLLWLASGGLGR